jgi:rod shape-determining protein MreB
MNRLTDTLVIDIGAGTIDICPVCGTFPTDEEQVTLPLGGDHIDEHFARKLAKAYPDAQVSPHLLREIKEKYGFVHDVHEKAVVTLPCAGKPKPYDVTACLKAACLMIVPPIVEAVRGLITRYEPEYQQRLLGNIVLGGGGSGLAGLDRVIEDGLKEYGGAKVRKVSDACFAGAVGALKLAMSMPADCWTTLRQRAGGDRPNDPIPLTKAA